jgi:peptidoglycan-associated lipoprotein
MKRVFSCMAGLLILLSSIILAGCPKKVVPVEDSAGLTEEKRMEGTSRPPLLAPPGEERFSPPAGGEVLGQGQEETQMAPGGTAVAKLAGLEDIFFDFDQWLIRPDAKEVLEKNARWLDANQGVQIQVEGHADERGTHEYNLTLGERRAKSVMNFLANLGVSPTRISIISYGEERPFCDEQGEPCYQRNRRAHFKLR